MRRADVRIVTKVAKEVRNEILDESRTTHGECYEASRRIGARLLKLGYKPKLVQGFVKLDGTGIFAEGFHYWIEVEGRIVDVTGDQFNDELNVPSIAEVIVEPPCRLRRYRRVCTELLPHDSRWS